MKTPPGRRTRMASSISLVQSSTTWGGGFQTSPLTAIMASIVPMDGKTSLAGPLTRVEVNWTFVDRDVERIIVERQLPNIHFQPYANNLYVRKLFGGKAETSSHSIPSRPSYLPFIFSMTLPEYYSRLSAHLNMLKPLSLQSLHQC